MQLLSRRASDAIDRLTRIANGNQAVVNKAIELYYAGKITDLVGYVRDHGAQHAAHKPANSQSST